MGERVIVSDREGIRTYACPSMSPEVSCMLEGACALCTSKNSIYAASCNDQAIWKLNGKRLTPEAVYPGGPGVAQLLLSRDGEKLYALCSDADSLLMISAKTGSPMVLSRVGVNPCAMAMDERGDILAVAGGAAGEVLLLSAHSLRLMSRMPARGLVFSVVMASGILYALSLNESLNSVLTAFFHDGSRWEISLAGMPGTLALMPDGVAAATHEAIFFVLGSSGKVYGKLDVPGRAGRLLRCPWGMVMNDLWSDSLFWRSSSSGVWKRIAQGVRDVMVE